MFEKACMERKFVRLYAHLFVKAIKEDSYKNIKDKKKGQQMVNTLKIYFQS